MKQACFLFIFFILSSSAYSTQNNWVGEWKINDKDRYMSLSINESKSGLELFYDEGIGINGVRANGIIKLSKKNAFSEISIRGSQCRLKLQLINNEKLSISGCELESYFESTKAREFVPKSYKLYYKASFNCAKAGTIIELAICDSKTISAADRKLGALYKRLRKKLTKKDKKRLRKDQRRWIKSRDWNCNKKTNDALNYCLNEYYGQRLLSLNLLNKYGVWHSSELNYSLLLSLSKQKPNSSYKIMDDGLGLWLSGKVKRALIDTGHYDVQELFLKDSYILSGPYSSDPSAGHDPLSVDNKIFIEFSSSKGLWVALVDNGRKLTYMPKYMVIEDASEKFNSWIKGLKNMEVLKIF